MYGTYTKIKSRTELKYMHHSELCDCRTAQRTPVFVNNSTSRICILRLAEAKNVQKFCTCCSILCFVLFIYECIALNIVMAC